MRDRFRRDFRRSIWAARRRYALARPWTGVRHLEDPAARRLLRCLARHVN